MEFNRTKSLEEYGKMLFYLQQRLKYYEKIENKEGLRKSYASQIYCAENLTNEVWKKYPMNPRYMVSNKGRIKYKGKIQRQTNQTDSKTGKIMHGYLVLENKRLLQDYIYNFVAVTFLGKIENDGYHVHHITNDGYDNNIDNLILLTATEHSIVHGFKIG